MPGILAARQPGIAEIPVMVAAGWSEAQKRAYVLAGKSPRSSESRANRFAISNAFRQSRVKLSDIVTRVFHKSSISLHGGQPWRGIQAG
jgi:hypothetical protein